jgi:hypothetical protein
MLHALFLRVTNESVTEARHGHSFGCYTGYCAPLAAREDGQHRKKARVFEKQTTNRQPAHPVLVARVRV